MTYMEMVNQNGMALKYAPYKLRTAALCIAAVKQYKWALEYVPKSKKRSWNDGF